VLKMLDRITGSKAEVAEPLFSSAHVSEARRAEAWLHDRIAKAKGLADGDMFSEVVTITPALAEIILNECNRGNRSLKAARFSYAKKMAAGQWKLTSQGISFSRDGILNNGQNRLTAVVLAARPIRLYVTFGEDRAVFDVLDTGVARDGGDALHIAGYKNTKLLASAARLLSIVQSRDVQTARLENDDSISVVQSNPRLEDATTIGMRVYSKLKCSPTAATVAFFLIAETSPNHRRLDGFVDRLCAGTELRSRDPILSLREGLLRRELEVVRDGTGKNVHVCAAIINAWNKHVFGKNAATAALRWSKAQPFPKPE
jgi:hypothetical protein